ncbi:putative membrane protein YeaQ/YmgE (transglycosylase-associated protein family) [Anoxybacillus calidus]|jgi:hypothetical protein|uniref:Putative membrane protein YeaQ/YmgE (Transglycosylase-associated protein family) n=1 Tax=[Anoxybacillus] calidus TaxID=575178 RepID=A0A7V9Z2C0_9BACL|nr:hypothetical protein [Anoxybacillus calidus]MBA2872682.1 putative membrane protein YeaQ/YmgE (transglycosylase-associated protein family) [Anoxybacillus calidus]
MKVYLISIFIVNVVVVIQTYRVLRRKRKWLGEHYAMTSSIVSSGIFSLTLSMLLRFFLFDGRTSDTIICVLIGVVIGIVFGTIASFQAVLGNIFNGIMGSLTGTMVGVMISSPSLCGLSNDLFFLLIPNIIKLSLFGTCVMFFTLWTIVHSLSER